MIGWDCVINFVAHLDETSATFRARHPEEAMFASRLKQAYILADLFDAIRGFEHTSIAIHTPKGRAAPSPPKRYPRPGVDDGVQRIGKGAIPISEFEDWYYGG